MMDNCLRKHIFAGFLCVFFSCRAMENSISALLNKKQKHEQAAMVIMGTVVTLIHKRASHIVCKAIPALKPLLDDVQVSLLLSGKGKELKLSNNIWISLVGLYIASRFKEQARYKKEFLVGMFIVAPLITTIYPYVTKPHQSIENNNAKN
jgi:hypothetical protein